MMRRRKSVLVPRNIVAAAIALATSYVLLRELPQARRYLKIELM
jgi:hypothetical protein